MKRFAVLMFLAVMLTATGICDWVIQPPVGIALGVRTAYAADLSCKDQLLQLLVRAGVEFVGGQLSFVVTRGTLPLINQVFGQRFPDLEKAEDYLVEQLKAVRVDHALDGVGFRAYFNEDKIPCPPPPAPPGTGVRVKLKTLDLGPGGMPREALPFEAAIVGLAAIIVGTFVVLRQRTLAPVCRKG